MHRRWIQPGFCGQNQQSTFGRISVKLPGLGLLIETGIVTENCGGRQSLQRQILGICRQLGIGRDITLRMITDTADCQLTVTDPD